MKIGSHGTRPIKSIARAAAVVALMLTMGGPASSFAGDVSTQPAYTLNTGVLPQPAAETGWLLSAQPSDSLGVVSSSTGALPQAGGAVASETAWLSRFHVTGYLSEQFGMWQNPTTLRSLTPARNNLALARTTLQVDENFQLDEHNSFFMREWFTYDPPYSWNSANNKIYSRAQSCVITAGVCDKLVPGGGVSIGPHSYGHFTNDALNQYDVRDAWWQNKWGPLTTFVGNQIVVWGQSLSFRVGDIVNPSDTAWAFGFANLEQSRKPQWMVHPILNLPDFGPLSSNFLEVVWMPGWAPQWWECDYADQRYDGYQGSKCGRMVTGQASLSSQPFMRFEGYRPQKIYKYGVFADPLVGNNINGPFDLGLSNGTYPTGVDNNGFIPGAGLMLFSHCQKSAGDAGRNETLLFGDNPGAVNVFNQVPLFLRRPCNNHLSKNQGITAGGSGDGGTTDVGRWRIRGYSPQFWNEGVRYHTLLGETELTSFLFYDNTNQGVQTVLKWTPYTNLFEYDEPAEVLAGLTANRPVPLPETIAEHFPIVAKGEVVYINHKQFDDRRPYVLTTRRFSDVVNWLAALDVTNAYAPWLSSTGDLNANLEVFDTITLDIAKDMDLNDRNPVHIWKNPVQILFNAGTSWYYGDIAPTWSMIFSPKGRTFLMFPSVTLNPPWTKKYFVRLSAIEVLGGDRQTGGAIGGGFKGQSFVSALLQYNFQLR